MSVSAIAKSAASNNSSPRPFTERRGVALLEYMDRRLDETLNRVMQSPVIRELADPNSSRELTRAIMREVLLEVWSYQQSVNEAVFTAVGRIGQVIDEQPLIRAMISVQIEEVGHGTLALRDHVALGGDEVAARTRRASGPSTILTALVRHLSERCDPLTHLGYMYFFEKFTTMITMEAAPLLEAKGFPPQSIEFMRLHAIEDIRHADMLANAIVDAVDTYPTAMDSIRFGFDCFAAVYPDPVWAEAYARAKGK